MSMFNRRLFGRPSMGGREAKDLLEAFLDEGGRGCRSARGPWEPPADVIETEDGALVRFEVAGARRDSLDLRILEDRLFLRGRRQDGCPRKKVAYRQMEIHYGPFERTVSLPFRIDVDKAQATYADGLLEVFVPRATERRKTTHVIVRIHDET